MTQAWYIPGPHQPEYCLGHPFYVEPETVYPSLLYEVRLLERPKNLPDRFKLEIVKVIWKLPTNNRPYDSGSVLFLPERDIFLSREEAIRAHKTRIMDYITKVKETLHQQTQALVNYADHLCDEKYISPFDGMVKD